MAENLDTKNLRIVQQEKLKELQAQQKNLKELQAELERINSKMKNQGEAVGGGHQIHRQSRLAQRFGGDDRGARFQPIELPSWPAWPGGKNS